MLDVQSRAIRQQHGLPYTTVIPNNLYGKNDNFDLENGHVIPAIIRKVWEAKKFNKPVILWGDGSPLREFTYAEDISRILINMVDLDLEYPINIGNTNEISIQEVTKIICNFIDFPYDNVLWDVHKPSGQYRKPSCNKKFKELFPDFEYTSLYTGLEKTCKWFMKEYPNVRGI